MRESPLLRVINLRMAFGKRRACDGVTLELYPGEVLGVVGESGSGKTTLLKCLAGKLVPTEGSVEFDAYGNSLVDIYALQEAKRRALMRSELGYIHQNPRDGLRLDVSAGGNIAERLMVCGHRHYGDIRAEALSWMAQVELAPDRIDDRPDAFSGGMQQRLQIARSLVSGPRLLLMDEPTGGLDVSVQARLLDLLRTLVRKTRTAAIVVTHDLGVARLLADQLLVMKAGAVVERGLTDQLLDDPHHAYTQLLVSSAL